MGCYLCYLKQGVVLSYTLPFVAIPLTRIASHAITASVSFTIRTIAIALRRCTNDVAIASSATPAPTIGRHINFPTITVETSTKRKGHLVLLYWVALKNKTLCTSLSLQTCGAQSVSSFQARQRGLEAIRRAKARLISIDRQTPLFSFLIKL